MTRISQVFRTTDGPAGTLLVLVIALIGAACVGALTSLSPLAGAAAGAIVVAVSLASLGQRLTGIFLVSLGVALTGYAFFGRSFAHLGVPPLFPSELLLALGLLAMLLSQRFVRLRLLHGLILLLMAWGALHTIPYVGSYGMDAFRDAVIWGYGAFAIIVSLMLQRHHMDRIVSWYGRLIPFFVIWAPLTLVIPMVVGGLPTIPTSSVPIITSKAGDVAVHLTGVGAFIVAGLYFRSSAVRPFREIALWTAWLGAAGLAGVMNRGGLVALGTSMAVAMFLRQSRHIATGIIAGVLLVTTLVAVDPVADLEYHRELSVDQLIDNAVSVFGSSQRSGTVVLEGTREWRLQWWGDIIDYTFQGPYFWMGKGFGINLANSDGYQTIAPDADASQVRSPHNGHLTVLARSGVPGFIFWVLVQATFGLSMLRALLVARRTSNPFWFQIYFWILIYWLAIMINASFDVYLEGPQGGIWFWTLIGIGIAALRLQNEEEAAEQQQRRGAEGQITRGAVQVRDAKEADS